MAKRTLTFDLFAKNNTSKAFKGVGDDANKMGDVLGKVGVGVGIAFAAAAAGIIAVGVDAFKALQRIETIGAQTTAVIKSTGGAANVTAEDIAKLSDALERKTATESESIREGANLLLTFTNIRNGAGKNEKVFDRATELMVDYARAMGMDASDGAIQLGKALNDPIKGVTALGKAGVQFTDDQKELIKSLVESGDLMGAQTIILDELQTQFGGSGAAYAGTFAGQIDTLKNNLGGMAEEIVIKLMPVLTAMLDYMNGEGLQKLGDFADWFLEEAVPAIGAFIDTLTKMKRDGTLIPSVLTALAAVTLAQLGLNIAMNANPVGAVISGIAVLAGYFTWLGTNSDSAKNMVLNAADNTLIFLATAAISLNNMIGSFVNGIIGMINGVYTPLNALLTLLNLPTFVIPKFVPNNSVLNGMIGQANANIAQGQTRSNQTPARTSQRPRTFMAEGGIVRPTPGGTAATIGEAGQAEAVIPLSAASLARFGLGGGGGVTVIVNGSVLSDERKLATAVRDALKNQRGQGFSTQGAFA